ncbi:hypothetical protein EVC02_008 [Rhizobium phage RHph_N17]|nr:hypothetical protein EVC02_008 [Rhizobium phage RHph_N17]
MKFKYSIFAVLAILLVIFAIILSPLLAGLSVIFKLQKLPGFWQWFSTVDDTLDGGQRQHPEKYKAGVRGVPLWWQRTCWICRNPAQGFCVYAFGYPMSMSYLADEIVKPHSKYKTYRLGNGDLIFSYQVDVPLFGKRHLKLWFGWARKTSILRYSLKAVPISFDTWE